MTIIAFISQEKLTYKIIASRNYLNGKVSRPEMGKVISILRVIYLKFVLE